MINYFTYILHIMLLKYYYYLDKQHFINKFKKELLLIFIKIYTITYNKNLLNNLFLNIPYHLY